MALQIAPLAKSRFAARFCVGAICDAGPTSSPQRPPRSAEAEEGVAINRTLPEASDISAATLLPLWSFLLGLIEETFLAKALILVGAPTFWSAAACLP